MNTDWLYDEEEKLTRAHDLQTAEALMEKIGFEEDWGLWLYDALKQAGAVQSEEDMFDMTLEKAEQAMSQAQFDLLIRSANDLAGLSN